MAPIELHPDFKDFLRLLNEHSVDYLLIGGYAVGYHGYPRATGDLDIWIAVNEKNAEKTARVLRDFGMPPDEVTPALFLEKGKIIRMGYPPVRIEVITEASGVQFEECFPHHETIEVDSLTIPVISLSDLKRNKKAAGRNKDKNDLDHLP